MEFDITKDTAIDYNIIKFKGSETSALISYPKTEINHGMPDYEVVEIPEKWKTAPICLLVIEYLKCDAYKGMLASSQYKAVRLLSKFIDFLDECDHDPEDNSTAIINPLYLNHIKRKNKGSVWAAYSRIGEIRRILKWASDQAIKSDMSVNGWNDNTRTIYRNLPKIDKPRSQRKKSMSQIFDGIDHSDYELLKGLRCVAAWHLIEAKRQREYLIKEVPEVLTFIKEWKNWTPNKAPFHGFPRPADRREIADDKLKAIYEIYSKILNAVMDSNNPLLIERVYSSKPRFVGKLHKTFDHSVSLEEMKAEIRNWTSEGSGRIRTQFVDLESGKRSALHAITTLTLADFVMPSKPEMVCMYWLLSSDRIQAAGIDRLEIKDVHLSTNEIQITEYGKNRSTIKSRQSVLYKKGSAIFEAMAHFYGLMKELPSYSNLGEQNHRLIPFYSNKINDTQKNVSIQNGLVPLQLVCFQGSFAQAGCLEEFPESSPFIDLYKKTVKRAVERTAAISVFESNRYENKRVKVTDYDLPNIVSISADLVANTRANVNTSRGNGLNDHDLDAYQTAHSPETFHNTYKDRTVTKEKVVADGRFAARVGDLMTEDAEKVMDMLGKLEPISIDQVEKKLGLTSYLKKATDEDQINSIIEEANTLEYLTGMFGEVYKGEKTFVVMTPITAALITGYIEHIDKNLAQLKNDNPARVESLYIHKAYLIEVLNRFPANLKREAEMMLPGNNDQKKVVFPYPPLS